MNNQYNLTWLNYNNRNAYDCLTAELAAAGINQYARRYMMPKAELFVLRADNVRNPAANILKQELLSRGGEAAVHRNVVIGAAPTSAVVMMATERQYAELCEKLQRQQFGLPALAAELSAALANIRTDRWRIPYGLHYGGKGELVLGERTLVMGILNLTPDSFSDGGRYEDAAAAVARAHRMADEGADIIDIGGESTRPGYLPVTAEAEIARVVPVIERLRAELELPISIDTCKAAVAAAALAAGADIINDIWGLQGDAEMAAVAARYQAPVVAMHNQDACCYADSSDYAEYSAELGIQGTMLSGLNAFLRRSLELGLAAGMSENQFILDIGFGFGKTAEQNLLTLKALSSFRVLGRPLLIGTSGKSTIGAVLDRSVDERAWGTAATVAVGVNEGAQIVRVHDIKEMVDVVRLADAIRLTADREEETE